jgi:hypothetical protein
MPAMYISIKNPRTAILGALLKARTPMSQHELMPADLETYLPHTPHCVHEPCQAINASNGRAIPEEPPMVAQLACPEDPNLGAMDQKQSTESVNEIRLKYSCYAVPRFFD